MQIARENPNWGYDRIVGAMAGRWAISMIWSRMLAYITGTVDQELLLRNEYLAAENRILRAQIKGRCCLSDSERATLYPRSGLLDITVFTLRLLMFPC